MILGILLIHIIDSGVAITSTLFAITGMLSLYFLMPIIRIPLINYMLILFLILLSSFTSNAHLYWLPFFGFIIVEATIQLKDINFNIFYTFSIAVCLIFGLVNNLPIYIFLLMGIIFVVCYFLHHYVENSQIKGDIYEQLLMEYRQLKRKSVEQELLVRAEERTKIARDIHDSVGHKLTALLMQLEVMAFKDKTDSLLVAKELARESLEETRYAVRQLKSAEATGIQSVIELIRKQEIESRLHIHFTLKNGVLSLPISNSQSIVLYRVLQESLTNAMKYSDSKEVEVILGLNSLKNLQFEVKNKLLSDAPLVQGFGLTNMEERLKEIGGELKVLRTNELYILTGSFPIKGFLNEKV